MRVYPWPNPAVGFLQRMQPKLDWGLLENLKIFGVTWRTHHIIFFSGGVFLYTNHHVVYVFAYMFGRLGYLLQKRTFFEMVMMQCSPKTSASDPNSFFRTSVCHNAVRSMSIWRGLFKVEFFQVRKKCGGFRLWGGTLVGDNLVRIFTGCLLFVPYFEEMQEWCRITEAGLMILS